MNNVKNHISNLVMSILGVGVLVLMTFGFLAVAITSKGEIVSSERITLAVLGVVTGFFSIYAFFKGVLAEIRAIKMK